MLGKAPAQSSLFNTENTYKEKLKSDSFHHFLHTYRHEIFRDEDYVSLYCTTNGRMSVPPSILATACVLQGYHGTSDKETVECATYDIRWSVALGTELAEQPFAKSTLQEFRAKLIINEDAMTIFKRSLSYARERGYLKQGKMRIAMDTTHIFGKGAVKDTYNLVADGIKMLYTCLAQYNVDGLANEEFQLYNGKSFKGQADIDWDDKVARQKLLNTLVKDAQKLLQVTKEALDDKDRDTSKHKAIEAASMLLSQLLLQDLQKDDADNSTIKQDVSKGRIPSTTDPEIRHGRKSSSNRFNGHKTAVATDLDSELITAVDVVPGNVHDSETATSMVEKSQKNTGNQVQSAVGDCAYGTAEVREQFEESETELVAKVPKTSRRDCFSKHDFDIDLEARKVTCPEGHTTTDYRTVNVPFGKEGLKRAALKFIFPEELCSACASRKSCFQSQKRQGKVIQLHPREDLLQQAREVATTENFKKHYRERVLVEHSIARLVQRGIRKSRFFGRKRTLWQVALAAAVVNLVLIARKESSDSNLLYHFLRSSRNLMQSFISTHHYTDEWQKTRKRCLKIHQFAVLNFAAFRPGF